MKFLLLSCILNISITLLNAQFSPNDIILTIDNQKIKANDFIQTYNKNNQSGNGTIETVENYFNLYLNFKLKVTAALDAKLDTLASFKKEYKGYRDQLAKTYLTDTSALQNLIKEAYYRLSTESNISHIMVAVSENAPPADTLTAYNKILGIRKKIIAGESFEDLAQSLSDDPSSKSNKGYIGYIRAFRLPYSFESVAFNIPIGEVSQPVRTRFGYHLIKVNNKRTSSGEVKVAHIMIASPQDASDQEKANAESKIGEIYKRLLNGEPFDSVAINYSEDRYSARNGGELPWFGAGEMVPAFEETAFNLKYKGEISKPIQTFYGWHIVKLLDQKPVPAFDAIRNEIKSKVIQGDRYPMVEKSYITKLKNQYHWKANYDNFNKITRIDSIKIEIPKPAPAIELLIIGNNRYNSDDYFEFLTQYVKKTSGPIPVVLINSKFNEFIDKAILDYADKELEKDNIEFGQTIREYYEGLLLFEIMERQIWSKASNDSIGLENYYNLNKEKYNPQQQNLQDIKGLVISDYQTYMEDKWIEELKKKHKILVNTKLLNKIATKYKNQKP